MEIDHLMGSDKDDLKKPWSIYDKKQPFKTNPTWTQETNYVHTDEQNIRPLFNYIYLFDKENEDGNNISDMKYVYDKLETSYTCTALLQATN